MAMFAAWLQRTPKAEALKDLKLIQLVSELEELLIPSELSEIKDAAHGKVCRPARNHVYGRGVRHLVISVYKIYRSHDYMIYAVNYNLQVTIK